MHHTLRRATLVATAALALTVPLAACGGGGDGEAAYTSSPFDIQDSDLELGGQATYRGPQGEVYVTTTGQRDTKWERDTEDGSVWRTKGGDTIRLGVMPSPAPGTVADNGVLEAASAPPSLAAIGITGATTAPPQGGRITGSGTAQKEGLPAVYAIAAPSPGLGAKAGAPAEPTETLGWVVVTTGQGSNLDTDALLKTLAYNPQ